MALTLTKLTTVTVGSSVSTISFTSIPQTFTDLLLKFSLKSTSANQQTDGLFFKINGSSANFTRRSIYGDGSGVASSTQSNAYLGFTPGASATSIFGNGELYIPSYTSSNYKTTYSDNTSEANQTISYSFFATQLWSQTAAITQLDLYYSGGDSFAQYSTATLYGILKS